MNRPTKFNGGSSFQHIIVMMKAGQFEVEEVGGLRAATGGLLSMAMILARDLI